MTDLRKVAGQKAKKYGLDKIAPGAFKRQIKQESNYNRKAVSPAGARGVAQIMPGTAAAWHVNPDDPIASLDAAAKHMAEYVRKFGSYRNALVAYNAGPGRVGKSLPAETQKYIAAILGSKAGQGPGAAQVKARGTKLSTYMPGETKTDTTTAALDALMAHSRAPGQSLLKLYSDNIDTGQYTTKTPAKRGHITIPGLAVEPGGTSSVQQLKQRATKIDKEDLPYQWGGGHGATAAKPGVPLDCSGAVARLFNVNPRVSGEFAKWGKAGRGKHVTIWANPTHVLVEINGRFWGTSGSNPGGGAGWIPRGKINTAYLSRFTPRHPATM